MACIPPEPESACRSIEKGVPSGRPRAGCRAWARSALVEASDSGLRTPEGLLVG